MVDCADSSVVSGVISIPHVEVWGVSNWAWRQLFTKFEQLGDGEANRLVAEKAMTFQHLSFASLDETTACRVSRTLALAADELRWEIERDPSAKPVDLEFAQRLAVLEMNLHNLFD